MASSELRLYGRAAANAAYTAGNDLSMLDEGGNAITTITPTRHGTARFTVCLSAAAIMYFRTSAVNQEARGGRTLLAGKRYVFESPVDANEAFSIRFSADATVRTFFCSEVLR